MKPHNKPIFVGPHLPTATSYYEDIMSRFSGVDELTAWRPISRNDWLYFQTELAALDKALGFGDGQCHECAAAGRMQYSQDGHTLRYGYACKSHAHLTPPQTAPMSVARRRLYEAFHDGAIDRATLSTTGVPWFIRRPLSNELEGGVKESLPSSMILVTLQGSKMIRSELRIKMTPSLAARGITTLLGAAPGQIFLPTDLGRVWLEGVARGLASRHINREELFDKAAPWTKER
jgi:hypothetical protein